MSPEARKLVVSHFCREVSLDFLFGYTSHDENYLTVQISFSKFDKKWRKVKTLPYLEISAYHQEKPLCIIIILVKYLLMLSSWREKC